MADCHEEWANSVDLCGDHHLVDDLRADRREVAGAPAWATPGRLSRQGDLLRGVLSQSLDAQRSIRDRHRGRIVGYRAVPPGTEPRVPLHGLVLRNSVTA